MHDNGLIIIVWMQTQHKERIGTEPPSPTAERFLFQSRGDCDLELLVLKNAKIMFISFLCVNLFLPKSQQN